MALEKISKEVQDAIDEELLYEALKDELNSKTVNSKSKKKKKKANLKKLNIRLRKDINIKTVLILIVVLIMNTYAWFLYISTVDASFEMHVRDWQILVKDADGTQNFDIICEDIYPGYNISGTDPEATQRIEVENAGEIDSDMTLTLVYARILDQVYTTATDKLVAGDDTTSGYTIHNVTTEELYDLLTTPSANCPFKVEIKYGYADSTGTITYNNYTAKTSLAKGTTCYVYATINWPYSDIEDANLWDNTIDTQDEYDTYFGNLAKDFRTNFPSTKSVVVKLEIKNTEAVPTATP